MSLDLATIAATRESLCNRTVISPNQALCARQGDDLRSAYEEAWRSLNSANIAVYPVDSNDMDVNPASLQSANSGMSSSRIADIRGTNGLRTPLRYLSLEYCDHIEYGCPLTAFAPELARADKAMKPQIFEKLKKYRSQMLPFMPGQRTADKERAFFFHLFNDGRAIEIARMLPEPVMQEKVLASAKDLPLRSF